MYKPRIVTNGGVTRSQLLGQCLASSAKILSSVRACPTSLVGPGFRHLWCLCSALLQHPLSASFPGDSQSQDAPAPLQFSSIGRRERRSLTAALNSAWGLQTCPVLYDPLRGFGLGAHPCPRFRRRRSCLFEGSAAPGTVSASGGAVAFWASALGRPSIQDLLMPAAPPVLRLRATALLSDNALPANPAPSAASVLCLTVGRGRVQGDRLDFTHCNAAAPQ